MLRHENSCPFLFILFFRAAAIMMQTGPVVTLHVAKYAASFHGLGALLSDPSSARSPGESQDTKSTLFSLPFIHCVTKPLRTCWGQTLRQPGALPCAGPCSRFTKHQPQTTERAENAEEPPAVPLQPQHDEWVPCVFTAAGRTVVREMYRSEAG